MAALLVSSQSSLASQLLQKGIAIRPPPCGSGLARDGSAADFKAVLAGKPAPTDKHSNPPLLLWERACPRWQHCWFQGKARWQASSYREASQPAPPPVGAGLPAMAALLSSSQLLQKASISTCYFSQHLHQGLPACGAFAARRSAGFQFKTGSLLHIGDEPLTLGVNCSRSR